MMRLFDTIYKDIADEYRVNVYELAKSFGIKISEDGFLDFSELSDFSLEELNKFLFLTISWLEHLNYKKSLVSGVISVKKSEISQKEAIMYLNIKSSVVDSKKKVTVADLENMLESNEEIAGNKKKLALYESYLSYLEGLYSTIEMLHYAIKHKISTTNGEMKKY